MKILFDHNVPRQLRRSLPGHEVRTAIEMNWAELENGDLLASGEAAGFDLMITGDKSSLTSKTLPAGKSRSSS